MSTPWKILPKLAARFSNPGSMTLVAVSAAAMSSALSLNFNPSCLPRNNTIDAAIALSSTTNLGNATPANGYGLPKTTTAAANIGLAVQKYGRTTSLTQGSVSAINGTIKVGYDIGTATFINQIVVRSARAFILPGDSGSLLVTDPGKNPVGLLFAADSSGKMCIANPIDAVLSQFNVTIDGE